MMNPRQTIPNLIPPTPRDRRAQYNMNTRIYNESGAAIRDPGTFAFMFTNIGDTTAEVNGVVIFPGTVVSVLGDSRTVACPFEGYEYVGNITIKFTGVIGASPAVELVTLYYPQ
jgi:hypothetical protein